MQRSFSTDRSATVDKSVPWDIFTPVYTSESARRFGRRDLYRFVLACLALFAGLAYSAPAVAQDEKARPNIVWIMGEDSSKHYFRHFDRDGAETPAIESMAQHGITFDRAFSNSPVCSVARTTLITSCYAPRLATQFHRKLKQAQLPPGLRMFPAYLRDAGYYTTNHSKQDYNAVRSDDVWDESSRKASWQNRPDKAMPFFHVLTSTLSHESSLHFDAAQMQEKTATDPASVRVQPYFPDTPTFRYTRARYHDRIMAIDRVVRETLEELEQAGELENTFVFFFGDHGGVLPRSKGYLYESGLHVPLVVRVPENFRRLAGRELGSRTDGFVEFVDFGPTVLKLAGLDAPETVDGTAFLGADVDPGEVDVRNEALGYADRFDEKYDLVRSLREGRFKYIRNFEPFLPDGLQNNYRYRMLAYQQWRERYESGELNAAQRQFFEAKPAEALYDLENDPHEVNNLAGQPEHTETLKRLRQRLMDRLKSLPDLSFLTEAVIVDQALNDPVKFGQQHQKAIAELIETANLALLPFDQAAPQIRQALNSDEPLIRYWALVAATSFGEEAAPLIPLVEKRLVDLEPMVVMRAVEFLAIASDRDPRSSLYRSFQRATSDAEGLRMLNTAVLLNDFSDGRLPIEVDKIQFLFKPGSELERRLDYLSR